MRALGGAAASPWGGGTWRTMDWTLSIAGHGAERAQSEPDRAVRVWVQAGWAF